MTPETTSVAIKSIERHCVVHYVPRWREHSRLDSEPDHFFLTHSTKSLKPTIRDLTPIASLPFNRCTVCAAREDNWRDFREPYKRLGSGRRPHPNLASVERLKTLDLCAGPGGLSYGLQKTGLFEACWAVENNVQAARSYKWVLLDKKSP